MMAISLLVWFVGFMTVGGNGFLCAVTNLERATSFRFYISILVVLIFVMQTDKTEI